LNRRQAWWDEEFVTSDFDLYCRKRICDAEADTFSWCPAFTFRAGCIPAAGSKALLRKEKWLEVEEMQIENNEYEMLHIGAFEVDQLSADATKALHKRAIIDD